MKKILYYLIISVTAASLLGCVGMPESEYSPPSEYSSLMGGNQQDIVLLGIGNVQQGELIGLWKAKNVKNNSYSLISFDENGNLLEDIYSDLSGEKMASIEGQYSAQNERLEISTIKGDVYQFEYLLKSGQLILKSLSK